jgi:cysteine-rich repeat protein
MMSVALLLSSSVAWPQAVFLVNDATIDEGDTNLADNLCKTSTNTCTIRAAVQQANATAGVDTILITPLPSGAYPVTITGTGEDAAATGDLDVTEAVTFNAIAGSGAVIIDGGMVDRVFHVVGSAGQTGGVKFQNMTIRNGAVSGGNGGGLLINAGAEATLNTVIVTSNAVQGTNDVGGGIAVGSNSGGGTLTINMGSTVSSNTAVGAGGGLWAGVGSVVTATQVTISGNSAASAGGVSTSVSANVSIRDSVVDNNSATTANGGGLYNVVCGVLTVTNSTVSSNTAKGFGGGVFNDISYGCGTNLHLANATIAFNHAGSGATGDGGGLYNHQIGFLAGNVNFKNTIISNNFDDTGSEAPDCGGRVINSLGYNLIGTTTGCTIGGTTTGNKLNKNPNLLPLANYGGLTRTHAITGSTATSDAYNMGNPAGCTDFSSVTLTTDQRGSTRPVATVCDIGAYEAPQCGNGVETFPETCDDGNTTDGDACDAACFDESMDTDHNEPEAAGATNGELVTAYADCVTPNQSTVAPPSFVTFACNPPARSDTVCAFNDGTAGTIKGTYKIGPNAADNDVRIEVHLDGLQFAGCDGKTLGMFVSFNETGHLCEQDDNGYSDCTRKTQQVTDIFAGTCTVVTASGNTKCDFVGELNNTTGIQRYRKNRDVGLEIRGFKVKRCTSGSCTNAADFGVTTFVPGILLP